MVRQCVVCHEPYSKEHRSFHILPADHEARKLWLDSVGVKDLNYSKYTYICSDHFDPSDFEIKSDGRKYLKKGSIPRPLEIHKSRASALHIWSGPRTMEVDEDVDDPMEIDDTVQRGQIIETRTDDLNLSNNMQNTEDQNNVLDTVEIISSSNSVISSETLDNKIDDVVILDDDDSDTESRRCGVGGVVEEIIDLVETVGNTKCINYTCKNGENLMVAPGFCLSYYRVKCSKAKIKEICEECYDIAVRDYEKAVKALIEGSLLFEIDLPLRNDVVEIDDSDEEKEEQEEAVNYIDAESTKLIENKLDDIIDKAVIEFDMQNRVDREVTCLKTKTENITKSLKEVESNFKTMRQKLDRIQIDLYNQFRPEIRELKGLNIIDDRSVTYSYVKNTVVDNSTNKVTEVQKTPAKITSSSSKRLEQIKMSPSSSETLELPPDLPKMGPIEKPQLMIGETYYITRDTGTGPWIRSRLLQVIPADASQGQYNNKFKLIELKQFRERIVTGKQLAYMTPSPVRLEVGTRVLAAFKEIGPTGETKKPRNNPYYPGIVAEPPVVSNKYRYLIFFDIGYSQYVDYKLVNVVFESSTNVWEDMSADSQAFIKKYLESADHPMIKTAKDHTVRTEYNGKWWLCTVMNVDCSLVQVFFDNLNRMEWIYRGSTRLNPIFREEQAASNRLPGARLTTRKPGSNETATVVQYTRNTDFSQPDISPPPAAAPPVRAVARKSTNKPPSSVQPPNTVPFLPPLPNNVTPPHPVGPTSKIMYYTPRDNVITTRRYGAHKCSARCKEFLTYNVAKLRGHNPLSKPLLCGWARMTVKVRAKKEIIYKAPCGRLLRHMGDVHYYLTITESNMTVDLFDFNQMVRCLAEFSVECEPDPKDLSKGQEQVPIPVVNGINSEKLEFNNYSTKRVTMPGVKMNLDPDFLCGCDCDDDCIDKTKCACWKLTLEGAKYVMKDIDPNSVGYIYRRLNEQVSTGIYECNSRCKCNQACLNRVVQHPLSLKLQVFKTINRGWGIRALNDVPQGTFICIYAGKIYTENMANEDGMAFGDEYLLDLDYIESVEKVKEDYESDVPESSDEEDRTTSSRKSPPVSDDEEFEKEDSFSRQSYSRRRYMDDNDFVPENVVRVDTTTRRSLRRRNLEEREKEREREAKLQNKPEAMEVDAISGVVIKKEVPDRLERSAMIESITGEIDTVTISDDEDEDREILSFNPKTNPEDKEKKIKYVSIRELFGAEESVYVMDAKNAGNIGRFLNHSCSPNVFVQNVFVDSHDPRFHWVAFFSSQFIRAGTELVWNYNYDIGSVKNRVLYCHCASLECKGRLL